MKKETKRLFEDFPNLISILIDMRQSQQLSYVNICKYFNNLGYKCSRNMIQRLYNKYDISSHRDKTGEKNPFFGKKHSDETKNKISSTRKEKGLSKGDKNFFYGKKKEKSQNWKGGISSKNGIFYSSIEWKEKRKEIFLRDNFTCLLCRKSANNKHSFLNAHHIIPMSQDWDKRLDNDNLITLCVDCHTKTFGVEESFINIFQDIVRSHKRL